MTSAATGGLVAVEGGGFRFDGAITIEAVPAVLESGARTLTAAPKGAIRIDLGGLTEFDSAALGVMFEWQRRVSAQGGQLRYEHLPTKLQTLAQLYGVDGLLGGAVDSPPGSAPGSAPDSAPDSPQKAGADA